MKKQKKDIKYHYSPVKRQWVKCTATKRPCRYGIDAHRTKEELERLSAEEKSKAAIKSLDLKTLDRMYGSSLKAKLGKKYTDALKKAKDSNTAYDSIKEETVEKIIVEDSFDSQMEKHAEGETLLGQIELPEVPKTEAVAEKVKSAPTEKKEKLAKAYLESFEAEEAVKNIVYTNTRSL